MRVLVWAAILGLGLAGSAVAPGEDTRVYAATWPVYVTDPSCQLPASAGGICFPIAPSDRHLSIRIDDLGGMPVRAWVAVFDAEGLAEVRGFCNQVAFDLPPGSAHAFVSLTAPFSDPACYGAASVGVAVIHLT